MKERYRNGEKRRELAREASRKAMVEEKVEESKEEEICYCREAQGKERQKYFDTETTEERRIRLQCLLQCRRFVIPARSNCFVDRILGPMPQVYAKGQDDQ